MKLTGCWLVLLVLSGCLWAQGIQEKTVLSDTSPVFPLAKGTTWQYSGNIRWTEGIKVHSESISWEMKVEKTILRRDGIEIAYIKGHPGDLCWYQKDKAPGNYLIARYRERYYLVTLKDNNWQKVAAKIVKKDGELSLADEKIELFLELPLYEGRRFADLNPKRSDNEYCWYVEKVTPASWSNLPVTSTRDGTIYQLTFKTNPDQTTYEFLPRVGIVSFNYRHSGTVAEVDLRLVRFVLPGKG